ncbi:MAG: Helix-turn-helix, AraC protein [Gemmatimonadetes bacterium]|nr:Helix-turn-helix, AraC protein [Gemmatimonadota bacterium]
MSPPTYAEHAPPPRLAPLVECVWTSAGSVPAGGVFESRVLPDGCMDVIFDLRDSRGGSDPDRGPRSYVVGAMRTPLHVRMAGSVDLLGVRFRPGGATPFVDAPAGELTDRSVGLDALWGAGAAAEMEERLHAAAPADRPRLAMEMLTGRLSPERAPDARVMHASGMIERLGGRVAVAELCRAVGLTRRHLERIFLDAVGLPPKTACRVARVQAAIRRVRGRPVASWSRLALDCGWYDQAHMGRDFREIAGTSPGAYLRDVASVQDAAAPAA